MASKDMAKLRGEIASESEMKVGTCVSGQQLYVHVVRYICDPLWQMVHFCAKYVEMRMK